MSKNLTHYNENFDRSYDDFEKEGMNLDDLMVKSKFNFNSSNLTFSSKSKLNWGAKSSAVHEYGLKHKCPRGTVDFKHKAAGETSVEVEKKLMDKDDIELHIYSKLVLDQGEDRKNCNANVMLRVHHKNNGLLSFGVENWAPCCHAAPTSVSAYGSYGHIHEGAKLAINGYLNFDIQKKFLPLAKVLISAEKNDVKGYFLTNINRSQVETDDKENPSSTNQLVDVVAKVVKEVNSTTKVGGVVAYNVEDKKADITLIGMKKLDRVKLNGKVGTDRSLTLGITSQHDDVSINFAAKSTLNSRTDKVGESEETKHWVTYKFGMSAEFNRL
jgi:hypothetical protein